MYMFNLGSVLAGGIEEVDGFRYEVCVHVQAAVLPLLVGTRWAISCTNWHTNPSSPLVRASFYHCLIVC